MGTSYNNKIINGIKGAKDRPRRSEILMDPELGDGRDEKTAVLL